MRGKKNSFFPCALFSYLSNVFRIYMVCNTRRGYVSILNTFLLISNDYPPLCLKANFRYAVNI